jgi:hypothetical protein
MTHFVDIDDKNGDVVDRRYYCSDSCASTDPKYQGWYGANELFSNEICEACSTQLVWYDEEEQTYKIGETELPSKHATYYTLFGTCMCYTCGALCENEEEE